MPISRTERLGLGAGIAKGINEAMGHIAAVKQKQEENKMKRESHSLDMKLKTAQIEQAQSEGAITAVKAQRAKDYFKAGSKATVAQLDASDYSTNVARSGAEDKVRMLNAGKERLGLTKEVRTSEDIFGNKTTRTFGGDTPIEKKAKDYIALRDVGAPVPDTFEEYAGLTNNAVQRVPQDAQATPPQGVSPQTGQPQDAQRVGANVPTTTTVNVAGVPVSTKYTNLLGKQAETLAGETAKKSAKTLDAAATQVKNFNKSVALFSGLVSQLKAKGKEQGGLGLIEGIGGKIATKFKTPGFGATEAFEGQRKETAIALNGVITGQNRVIKSVVEMINATLPDEFDPPDFAAAKIAQSLTNAFKLKRAVDQAILTPDELSKMSTGDLKSITFQTTLTPEENQSLESLIQEVLATQAAPARTLDADASVGALPAQATPAESFDREGALRAGYSEKQIDAFLNQGG